jgi:hypothetical protein
LLIHTPEGVLTLIFASEPVHCDGEEVVCGFERSLAREGEVVGVFTGEERFRGMDLASDRVALEAYLFADGGLAISLAIQVPDARLDRQLVGELADA